MGIFDRLRSKKDSEATIRMSHFALSEKGNLSKAELMANVVGAGLDSESYSDMNLQLEHISTDRKKEVYVFDHPGVVGTIFGITLCLFISFAFLYFAFIGVSTAWFSSEYYTMGLFLAVISGFFLFVNLLLIIKSISNIKRKTRYDVYSELIGFKSLEFVDDIALCAKQKKAIVIKDLNAAIKRKLIPQGHFSRENIVFMVSDEVYDRYMEKPAVYDRYFQKKLEERKRVKSRTKRISQIMEAGEQYIQKLHDFRSLIKDKGVVRQIERMENVVSMIFHEIDVNPIQVNSLGVFLNYYLPTTEKLLDTYVNIIEKKISVPKLSVAKKEIEGAIAKSVRSFESILEKLYEEYEMDITSDIEALELVMKKEGLPN